MKVVRLYVRSRPVCPGVVMAFSCTATRSSSLKRRRPTCWKADTPTARASALRALFPYSVSMFDCYGSSDSKYCDLRVRSVSAGWCASSSSTCARRFS